MKYNLFFFLVLLCCFFFTDTASGQAAVGSNGDSLSVLPLGNRQSIYMRELDENAAIYVGKAYFSERRLTEGHAFFLENGWNKGSIVYGGVYYEDIPLLFDMVKGELVILYQDGKSKIALHNENIDRFSLLGHTFLRLPQVSIKGRDMAAGFYDLLYEGEAKVLVKRTKTIKEDISSGTFRRFTKQDNRLYIKKGNAFYNVKSKGSVLRVFKDKRRELKSFLKKNNIKFHHDREQAAVEMAKYYDILTKEL